MGVLQRPIHERAMEGFILGPENACRYEYTVPWRDEFSWLNAMRELRSLLVPINIQHITNNADSRSKAAIEASYLEIYNYTP